MSIIGLILLFIPEEFISNKCKLVILGCTGIILLILEFRKLKKANEKINKKNIELDTNNCFLHKENIELKDKVSTIQETKRLKENHITIIDLFLSGTLEDNSLLKKNWLDLVTRNSLDNYSVEDVDSFFKNYCKIGKNFQLYLNFKKWQEKYDESN